MFKTVADAAEAVPAERVERLIDAGTTDPGRRTRTRAWRITRSDGPPGHVILLRDETDRPPTLIRRGGADRNGDARLAERLARAFRRPLPDGDEPQTGGRP